MFVLRAFFLLFGGFTGFSLPLPTLQAAETPQAQSVSVLAASSLTEVMAELSRLYSQRENFTISTIFDEPAVLAENIEMGEPGDILIVEDAVLINSLKRKGLLDVFRLTTVARNKLALAVPTESYLVRKLSPDKPLADLLKDINERTLLVIPDPAAAIAGTYTRQALTNLERWDAVKPYLVKAVSARNASYLVAHGTSAGILYFSDAFNNPDITILNTFDERLHQPIIYHASVVASENMPVARKFLEFLKSEEARNVFRKHGFTPL